MKPHQHQHTCELHVRTQTRGSACEEYTAGSINSGQTDDLARTMPVRDPVGHVVGCASRGVTPALGNGVILTLFQSMQGMTSPVQLPISFALNTAFVYSYVVLQCPMEALHGRQSLLHNALSGATLGYIGVSSRQLGLFNLEPTLLINRIPLPVGGALVYGSLAAALGAIGGKRL